MSGSEISNREAKTLHEFGIACGGTHPYLIESIDIATVEVVDAIYGVVTQVPKCNELGVSPHFSPISAHGSKQGS